METNDILDANTREKLWNKKAALSRLAGNEALLSRIVEMFLAQIDGKQEALNKSIVQGDIEAIRFNSHAIKGVSGDVGADLVRAQAAFIEQKAKKGDISDVEKDNEKLETLIDATITLMRSTSAQT